MHQDAMAARLHVLRQRQREIRPLVVPGSAGEIALRDVAASARLRVGSAGTRLEIEALRDAEAKARLRTARLGFDVRQRHFEARGVGRHCQIEAWRHGRRVQQANDG